MPSQVIHQTQSLVQQISAKPDKENEVRAWFLIGAELQKIGRNIKSPRLFGQTIKETEMKDLPGPDRSDARWMYQNWKDVLAWIELETGRPADDPFRMLSELNHSHPSAIRRQVREKVIRAPGSTSLATELAGAVRIAFEEAWKRSSSAIELSQPFVDEEEGIDYQAELYDPFAGTTRGRYSFSWSEIADVISNPNDVSALHEEISMWIVETGESEQDSELEVDDDGRVHFISDL